MSWAYALLSKAAINWPDKLLSGKVINISRVIKLSLSSHENVPVNDPLALCLFFFFFFIWVVLKRRTIANKQLLCGWREPFSNCLGLLTRPKPEIRAWKVAKQRADLMRL